MKWNSRCRIACAGIGISMFFSVYSVRLIYLQVNRHEELAMLAAEKHSNKRIISHRRGMILDRNGEVLADNLPMKTLYADGSHVKEPGRIAAILAPALGWNEADLTARITTNRKYVVIKREVPELEARELCAHLAKEDLRGIYLEHDMARFYPNGVMLSHVVGVLDHEHHGLQGVEKTMDHYLRGQDGYRFIEIDRTGKELVAFRGLERAPRDGYNVRLTVNMGLQAIVEKELDAACAELKPKGATVLMMEPNTGDILAMATRPTFDLNKYSEATFDVTRNRALIDVYEPGSTFKIVAIAAGLEEKMVTPDSVIYCNNGALSYGGKILRDHHPYGNLTVHQGIVKSSNILAAKVAMQLGEDRYHEYVRRFGFGDRTGIMLPGEVNGLVSPVSRWDRLTITRMPMGHAIGVTPLQMAAAMSVIANGGNLVMPRIVHSITDGNRKVIADFPPKVARRVVSKQTSEQVLAMLKDVVSEEGTAKLAAVPGFTVFGKTGTAQKVMEGGKGYMNGKYIVSFAGGMPAEKPAFVMLVVFDEAQPREGPNYGGLVAAPVFARIAEKAARYMDLEPCIDQPTQVADRIALTTAPRR